MPATTKFQLKKKNWLVNIFFSENFDQKDNCMWYIYPVGMFDRIHFVVNPCNGITSCQWLWVLAYQFLAYFCCRHIHVTTHVHSVFVNISMCNHLMSSTFSNWVWWFVLMLYCYITVSGKGRFTTANMFNPALDWYENIQYDIY